MPEPGFCCILVMEQMGGTGSSGKDNRQLLADIARSFGVDILHAFGSRAADSYRFVEEGLVVCGELLFAASAENEARYQLYVMRRAADLLPFQRERDKSVLGF